MEADYIHDDSSSAPFLFIYFFMYPPSRCELLYSVPRPFQRVTFLCVSSEALYSILLFAGTATDKRQAMVALTSLTMDDTECHTSTC